MNLFRTFLIAAISFSISSVFTLPCVSAEGSYPAASCEAGEWRCSDDAYVLFRCDGGAWSPVQCMRSEGKLCDNNACVEPWKYGIASWPAPPADPLATPETLAEKAKYFEESVARLHVEPRLKFISGVTLPCKPVECADGQKTPCEDCSEPSVPEEKATWRDVQRWHVNENDGLWNSLYIAAEAFRYAATRDPHALDMLRVLMDGETTRMKITGVPGIFTRLYIAPGVQGIKCPETKDYYTRAPNSDLNSWVKIGKDGCVMYVDAKTNEWKSSEHCGLIEYADWCWVDNVSKDEYSGHMFALGAVIKLVDDPQIQATARELLSQVAKHLIKNKMQFVDWDGTVTPFGRLHAMAMDDYAGFNAAMSLDFFKIAAEATKDPQIENWYDNCLLQKGKKWNCLANIFEIPRKYASYLPINGLYEGPEGCRMNYNNNSMHMLSLHNLIWFEHDPELRATYQKSLDEDVFRPKNQPRALMYHNNAFFDFIFASQKRLGPGSDGPAMDAVANGVNMLREMSARRHYENNSCPPGKCEPYCKDRFNDGLAQFPRTAANMCLGNFIWWDDPYSLIACKRNGRMIATPTDFLLPYWMGRYYGFISPDM